MAHAQRTSKDWREKYLDLVESQESQQTQFDQQLEQLRRALVRVSLAADGVDSELDSVLAALREHLKSPEKQHLLHKRLVVVEEAVIAFDERKLLRLARLQQAVESLIEPLRDINPSRVVAKACKSFNKSLKNRLKDHQEIPSVLQELAQIQRSALDHDGEKLGFLQKLLAGRDKNTTSLDSVPTEGEQVQKMDEEIAAVLLETFALFESTSADSQILQPIGDQLTKGINPDQLIVLLQQLRDLIAVAFAKAKKEFSLFLQKTNFQLNSITNILNDAAQAADQQADQHHQLCTTMDDQIQTLRETVDQASDLEQLKQQVNLQLETIRAKIALSNTDDKPDSLSDQLKQLLDQVQKFEKDAQETASILNQEQKKAQYDSLTGLPNRDAYEQRIQLELARWQRYKNPLTLAVVDIDLFKRINDSYGHQAGDKVLRLIAQTLRKNLRETDFIGRYGGEEFAVLLPESDLIVAEKVLNKIRIAVSETPFHFRKQPVQITVSIGYDQLREGDTTTTTFARADKALYQAKDDGRNCIVRASEE